MSRRIAITILASLAVLWSAAASAQDKINPNNPNQVTPNKVVPPPVIPNSVLKPPPLPADPTGGRVDDRVHQAEDAALAKKLADQQSALDAKMGAGPADDRPGFDKVEETLMQRICKSRAARAMFRGSCGSDPGGLPPDGDPSGFFDTKRPVPSATDPGGAFAFDGPTAGGGLPRRGGEAGDDDDTNDVPMRKPDRSWTDAMGQTHDQWEGSTEDGVLRIYEDVRSSDGTHLYASNMTVQADRRPGGGVIVHETTGFPDNTVVETRKHCQRGHCTESQPGESGYGQMKARPWFCARTPEAKGCKPTAPGSQIDPANPDGEGTPTGSRPATHRLGREAVSDPGPGDSEIRGTTGGGSSGPLDMKDPVNPDGPVKPDGRK